MKLGFGAEGSKYLRFCEEDSRTVENEEVFGVKKEVGSGMEMSELRVRHWMNLSWIKAEAAEEAERRRRNNRGNKEDAIIVLCLIMNLLFFIYGRSIGTITCSWGNANVMARTIYIIIYDVGFSLKKH